MPPLQGRYARLVRRDADAHAAELHRANCADPVIWDYLPCGPFSSAAAYHRWIRHRWIRTTASGTDPLVYAIRDKVSGHFGGVASHLRITPEKGSIEVGHINVAPDLQCTRAETEAILPGLCVWPRTRFLPARPQPDPQPGLTAAPAD